MARNIENGGSGYINFGAKSEFKIIGNLFWEGWIKLGAGSNVTSQLVDLEGGTSESESDNALMYVITQGSSDSWDIRYIHEYSSGSNEVNNYNTNLNNGVWYHVSILRNVTANTVILYVNGSPVSTFNYTNDPTLGSSSASYVIGIRILLSQNQLDDYSFAEFGLFDNTVPTTFISALGNGVNPFGLGISWVNLAPIYGNESPEPDYSINQNNGTVSGTTKVPHPPVELVENYL